MRKCLLLFLVCFLPLVMHLHFVEFPSEVTAHFNTAVFQPDIFNWWKNAVLYSVALVLLYLGWRRGSFFSRLVSDYFWLTLVSGVLSRYPAVAIYGMPNYLEGALAIGSYCILFLAAETEGMDSSRFDRPLTFCTSVMFLLCALQYWSPGWFQLATHWFVFGIHPEYRMSIETWPLFGSLMNQNILGTFAALVYAFFLARGKTVMTLISVLLAVGSQSRGAWFAMLIATLYLVCKYRKWRLALPLAFFAIGIGLVYARPLQGGFKWTVTSSGRTYVWKNTLSLLSPSTFFLGSGPGAFTMEFPQNDAAGKRAQGWTPETIVDRPHNFYLQVLHASGGLALIALLAVFAGFLLLSKEVAINAAVISYLVNVFFTDSCTSVAPLFWILLGTGVGRLKTLHREK